MSEEKKKHESYGMIGVSRYESGASDVMFGSSIKHRNGINITIHEAEHRREYHRDWYYANKMLVRLRMSANQFAEMITTLNVGSGVPCTLEYFNGERRESPPFEHTAQKHRDEFQAAMNTIAREETLYMKEAFDILDNKATISKSDRGVIRDAIKMLLQHVQSNLPFAQTQFQEQMDKTIAEAKSEIDAFVEHKVRSVGLEAIREQTPLLPE